MRNASKVLGFVQYRLLACIVPQVCQADFQATWQLHFILLAAAKVMSGVQDALQGCSYLATALQTSAYKTWASSAAIWLLPLEGFLKLVQTFAPAPARVLICILPGPASLLNRNRLWTCSKSPFIMDTQQCEP